MHILRDNMQTEQKQQEKTIDTEYLADILLAIFFVKGDPVSRYDILNKLNLPETELDKAIVLIHKKIKGMPFFLYEYGNSYQLFTRPEYKDYVSLFKGKTTNPLVERLSDEAIEVLAYIAYNQPSKKEDIDKLRGVDSDKVLKTLREKGLIIGIKNEDAQGCPIVYRTTDEFLRRFKMKSLLDLPPLVD